MIPTKFRTISKSAICSSLFQTEVCTAGVLFLLYLCVVCGWEAGTDDQPFSLQVIGQ